MLLLDTHTFVWLASERDRLSEKVIQMISDDPAGLFVSSITALELGPGGLIHFFNYGS